MSAVKIYLAKSGKITGPYSERDLGRIEGSGELERFSWMWRSDIPGWQPVDPMPAPLDEANLAEVTLPEDAPAMPRSAPPLPPTPRRSHLKLVGDPIEGICHDYRTAVSGRVVHVSESGCELLVEGPASPRFTNQAKVYLNLLNSKSGHTMDVSARVSAINHSSEGWIYRLEWGSVPELLRASG